MSTKNYRVVSQIIERDGRKPFWTKVGVAFDNKDGSINLNLHLLPNVQLHVGIPKVVGGSENTAATKETPDDDIPF